MILSLRASMQRRSTTTNLQTARHQNRVAAQRRVTITLISIVASFFMLVFPSELMQYYLELYTWIHNKPMDRHTVMVSIVTCNMLQAIFMSINFALYCIVNPNFRGTLKQLFGKLLLKCHKKSLNSNNYSANSALHVPLTSSSVLSTGFTEMPLFT